MKSKIDAKKVAEAYNKARMQFGEGGTSPKKMQELLMSFGLSEALSQKLTRNSPFFIQSKKQMVGARGNFKEIRFSNPKESIHYQLFENWLKGPEKEEPKVEKEQKNIPFEDECCNFLKEKGFRVLKPVFDLKRFKTEHPEIYKEYLYYTPC